MCGLAGFWRCFANNSFDGDGKRAITAMAASMSHRGPDDAGVWIDELVGIFLGHQRLAIQDLSDAGHQPMVSACGRYVIVLNGEIYNHLDLRLLLDEQNNTRLANSEYPVVRDIESIENCITSRSWNGKSDTETLLTAVAAWGINQTLCRCVGMFAFACWDRKLETLFLARDRFGEKPLYYGWVGQGESRAFAFASELKALRQYPGFDNVINRDALVQYLRFTYVPTPFSIYKNINKLEPGCLLTISREGVFSKSLEQINVRHQAWFSFNDLVANSALNPVRNETQAINELEHCLAQAVKAQSISDVPLGAFLSGGIDSTTITALMQEQSSTPIKTFTVGFDEAGFDETPYARAIAEYLGTDHTEIRVSAQMVLDVIQQLPQIYDEPFADSSQIAMHLVCRAARKQVVVALSGDAGDELFGGYNRYLWGVRIWGYVRWLPFTLRYFLGQLIQIVPLSVWNSLSNLAGVTRLGEKAHRIAVRLKTSRTAEDIYWSLVSEWSDAAELVLGGEAQRPACIHSPSWLKGPLSMMYLDTLTYLPDDILCKVDRAAMACSLETRVPFLDHRVVEFVWRLPLHMKIRRGVSKWVLRQVLYKRIPKKLIERPKAGFAIPVGQWLRGPLRDWAEALLNPSRLRTEGYLRSESIAKVWQEHLSGRYDHTPKLWAILMFQAWLENQSMGANSR